MAAQRKRPGISVSARCGLAVEPGHEQERARHRPAHPGPIAAGQEPEADRDRQRELDDRGHPPRRDVLHPRTEQGMSREVQLAGQRRVKVDPVTWRRASNRAGRRVRAERRMSSQDRACQSCSHHWAEMIWL